MEAWIQSLPAVPIGALTAGVVAVWVAIRKVTPGVRKAMHLVDDVTGEGARPGVPARPGVMERLGAIDTGLEATVIAAAAAATAADEAKRTAVAAADIADRTAADIAEVRAQMLRNGGTSMRDAVDRLAVGQGDLAAAQAEMTRALASLQRDFDQHVRDSPTTQPPDQP